MLFLVFLQTKFSRDALHRSHAVLLVANLALGALAWGIGYLIGGRDLATSPVRATDTAVAFTTTLTAGSHQLAPVFTTADGHEVGAYYAVVTKLP